MTNKDPQMRPKLRPVEAFPIVIEGEKQICIRDPLRICQNPIFVPEAAFFIISKFNGRQTVNDVQSACFTKFLQLIPQDAIFNLVDQLDALLLLDNDKFRTEFSRLKDEYSAQDWREPAAAGISYEGDADALKKQLDEIMSQASSPVVSSPVKGILAPHIDIRVGAKSFAAAYSHLAGCDAELYIIVGTGHMYSENLFTVVDKDYRLPTGTLPVDRDAIALLRASLGPKAFDENFTHRNEHSVEFQALFLRHILGPQSNAKILPVIVSSFNRFLDPGQDYKNDGEVSALIEGLKGISASKKTCWVAGVDFAHIGLKFGDAEAPSDDTLKQIQSRDMGLIETLKNIDGASFLEHFRSDRDARRVCGFPPLAIFVNGIDAQRGEMLSYEQSVENQTGSVVTFAAMSFY